MRKVRTVLMAGLAVAALGGCHKAENGDAAGNAMAATTNDMTPENGTSLAKLFGGGKPIAMDQQVQAINGAIIQLTSFQAKPTETVIGLKVVNGADRDMDLQWTDKKSFLVAGGQKFYLSPPMESPKMTVVKDQTMEGNLVFLGRLPKGVPVTLVFNEGMSNSEYSGNPNLSIPLQISDAGFTDDGSKKN